jgi:hypothetical protein
MTEREEEVLNSPFAHDYESSLRPWRSCNICDTRLYLWIAKVVVTGDFFANHLARDAMLSRPT